MKKQFLFFAIAAMFIISCTPSKPLTKSSVYKGMYSEKPLTILIMPPINKSMNVEAKEYFHSTLSVPLAEAGYYVIPPFLSMEILKKESAYDAEVFLNQPVNKFGEIFGADLALFTIIHKWTKNVLFSNVTVEIEYIVKSTKTNEVVYTRKGTIVCSTKVNTGFTALNMIASAVNTAVTNYTSVARMCNAITFTDLPNGKYSPNYGIDSTKLAGQKVFRASVSK